MSGNYASPTAVPQITWEGIRAATERFKALPRAESDITVSRDVWDALQANVPVSVGEPPPAALTVHVDDRLPRGAWHKGRPR